MEWVDVCAYHIDALLMCKDFIQIHIQSNVGIAVSVIIYIYTSYQQYQHIVYHSLSVIMVWSRRK